MKNSFLNFRILIALVFAYTGAWFGSGGHTIFFDSYGCWQGALVGLVSGLAVGYFWGLETLKIEMATGPLRIIRLGALHGAFAGFISGACTATIFGPLGTLIGGLIGGIPGLFLGLLFSVIITLIRRNPQYNGYKVSLSKAENTFAKFLRILIALLFSANITIYFLYDPLRQHQGIIPHAIIPEDATYYYNQTNIQSLNITSTTQRE